MQTKTVLAACLISMIALTAFAADPPAAPPPSAMTLLGRDTLTKIHSSFFNPKTELYQGDIDDGKKPHPSWIWDASIQLGALCAAAREEPATYLPQVKAYAAALRSYRTMDHDLAGLDVNPPPKDPDRYYDDNAWICLSLLEAHDLTRDPEDLRLATDAYNFMMSGEDAKDGGMYWHEDRTTSKNACTSGPAMLTSLKMFEVTSDKKYLETAKRLYDWTRAHLQDKDGLVFDSVQVPSGKISRTKFTYNSATLIRAACGLYQVTKEKTYLVEAQRVAAAAEKRFVRSEDGIITGAGKLGVKLIEAFLDLYTADHDKHWAHVVGRCLNTLSRRHNANGWYPGEWQMDKPKAGAPVRLIDQAAPARAYWVAVDHGVEIAE